MAAIEVRSEIRGNVWKVEVAVGDVDPTMRLALSLETELAQLVGRTKSDDARWFGVMGSGPLREVFETALGLPSSFGSLDIDKQLDVFRTRAKQVFGVGEVGDFTAPEVMDKLRTRFLIVAEATGSGGPTATSPALSILSGGTSSSSILATLYGL